MNRKEITEKFITAIEKGCVPWRKPFASISHRNHFTENIYQGINQFLLSFNFDASPYWGTFMQWKAAGCPVRKGERASAIIFYKRIEKENDEGERVSIPFMQHFSIFHAGQVDDPQGKFTHILEAKIETDFETAGLILESSGADIRIGGNHAFYIPGENYLRLPHSNQFDSEEARIATAFHELGHWGERNILGREMSTVKGTPEYAYGELVAEMTACFLCQACGVPSDLENHESYIGSWLKAMKNNTSYIFDASKDASKIADAILRRAGIKEEAETCAV